MLRQWFKVASFFERIKETRGCLTGLSFVLRSVCSFRSIDKATSKCTHKGSLRDDEYAIKSKKKDLFICLNEENKEKKINNM